MIQFELGNLYTRVEAPKEELKVLHQFLSVKVPNHYFSRKYRIGQWDGTKKFFNLGSRTLYTGLLDLVRGHLVEQGIQCLVVDKRTPVSSENNPLNLHGITLRPYQTTAIRQAVADTRGIVASPTGSGKCLTKNCLVSKANGTFLSVADLKVGDRIISLNQQLEQENDTVVAIYPNGAKPIYKLCLSKIVFQATFCRNMKSSNSNRRNNIPDKNHNMP